MASGGQTGQSPGLDTGRLGRYEMVRLLGRGGMGQVYLARDTLAGREVAVKTVLGVDSGEARERFLREVRAAAALKRPNAVAVYDVGFEGAAPYCAMEYVEGESLGALLSREGRLPARRAFDICRQVALALDCAHGQALRAGT